MQASSRVGGVPGSERLASGTVADAHEQHTLPDVEMLRFLGGAEVFERDVVTEFEPRLSTQAGDVEEHPATDDSVLNHVDRERARSAWSDHVDGQTSL